MAWMERRRRKLVRPVVALMVETSNAFGRELLHGVRDWMRERGGWAIHFSEQGRGATPPPWLKRWRGDGIIARVENPEIARAVRACGVPCVNVSAAGMAPGLPTVISDSAAIAALAADHLIERGLRQFGYAGDARFAWSASHGAHFAERLRQRGLPCRAYPASVADGADWGREQRKLGSWLRALPKPCGVMACYDLRGQQVLDVCREIGLRVPEDIAVIGQHNDELLCELCDPPLSSVIPDARRIGREAARALDALMRGRRAKASVLRIPPSGVASRLSTDVVSVGDPRLASAMRFLRAHACAPIAVGDIARAAGMSRSLLERRFRHAFRDSPWSFVIRFRLEAARGLLAGTASSVAEVAERTGFGSPEHLSATLRRHVGQTPGQIRRGGA